MAIYKKYKKIFTILCIFFVFVFLATFAGYMTEFDRDMGEAFLVKDNCLFNFVKTYTKIMNPLMATVIGISISLLFFAFKKYWQGFQVGLSLGAGALLNEFFKRQIMFERPSYRLIDEVGYTFPSGHSNAAAALAVSLMIIVSKSNISPRAKRFWILGCSIFMFTIAMTRLMLGVHYASDLMAGLSLGAATALLIYMCIYKFKRRRER